MINNPLSFVKKSWGFVLILFLIALFVRLPLLGTVFWRTPDAVEYISVARNLDNGRGLTQSIKFQFFDSNPVVTSALNGRPVFTSFIIWPLLHLSSNFYFLQLVWLILGSLNVVLFYFLLRKFVAPKFAFLGGMLLSINSNFLITNRLIVSEIPFMTLVFIFLLCTFLPKKKLTLLFTGIVWGLAFLSRWEGILLAIFLLPFFKDKKLILFSIVGFLIVAGPYLFLNFQIHGNPFASYNYNHFRVFNFQEGMTNGFGKSFPSAREFIYFNVGKIIPLIFQTFFRNAISLLGLTYLGLFSPLIIFNLKKTKKILFVCFLVLVSYSILWSAIFETSRHFIVIYSLLLIPVAMSLEKFWKNKAVKFVFVVMVVLSLVSDGRRIIWARTGDIAVDSRTEASLPDLYSWIKKNTQKTDVISFADPWLLNLHTDRPTILLPYDFKTSRDLDDFARIYNVKYVLEFGSEMKVDPSGAFRRVGILDGTKIYKRII